MLITVPSPLCLLDVHGGVPWIYTSVWCNPENEFISQVCRDSQIVFAYVCMCACAYMCVQEHMHIYTHGRWRPVSTSNDVPQKLSTLSLFVLIQVLSLAFSALIRHGWLTVETQRSIYLHLPSAEITGLGHCFQISVHGCQRSSATLCLFRSLLPGYRLLIRCVWDY